MLDTLNMETFRTWPLIRLGESKEIRQHPMDPNLVVIWLRPTIYSFTQNRTGWVEGSNLLRARVMRVLIPLLQAHGIDHAYQEICDRTGFIIARKILPSEDPNVEVIVKRYNSGTSHHRYYGLSGRPTRKDHPFWPNESFNKDEAFRGAKVRFDWRNPFWNPEKVAAQRALNPNLPAEVFEWPADLRSQLMMRDEVMGEDFAREVINTQKARRTALWTYTVLQQYLAKCNIVVYDLCLFITADGTTVYGEINQDCGRFRHLDLGMLDKDVWRSGGSVGDVLEKWTLLADMLDTLKLDSL